MDSKASVSDTLSFIIAILVIVAVLVPVAYVLYYGISAVSAQVESIQEYVTQTELALTFGTSEVVGTLAPSFNSNQFMVQFYGTPQCISLLDDLSRDAVLSAPNNPATLSGQFFVCSGVYKNFTFKPQNPLIAKSSSLWTAKPLATTTQIDQASALPNWVQLYNWSVKLGPGWSPTTYEINGSEGTMFYENDSTYQNIPQIEADLGRYCVEFLNASVVPYGPENPAAYITSMDCVPLGAKNGYNIFISLDTQNCASVQGGCNYDPLIFFHGSPAKIIAQFCSYNGGTSLVCAETIR